MSPARTRTNVRIWSPFANENLGSPALAARLTLVGVLLIGAAPVGRAAECSGCAGSGQTSQMTSANGFFVKVTATVESGICEPVTCVAEGCEVQVDREWDLPAGITMQFCTVRPPPQLPLCQFPPPTSGVGGPGSASANDTIRCGGYKVYTIETSSLSASTTGTCSQCS